MKEINKRIAFLAFLALLFWSLYVFKFAPDMHGGGFKQKGPFKKTELLQFYHSGKLLSAVAKASSPSVVYVKADRMVTAHPFFNDGLKFKQETGGSGIIISPEGMIVTNGHVVEGADTMTVTLSDQSEYTAKLIGFDSLTDVAVIKIDGHGLPAATLGNSDTLEPGEWVIAIGSPMGLFNSVSFGIVSALGRNAAFGDELYQDFIQTDAAINPGNSGGPLINLDGEVVGMNTLMFSPSGGSVGLGFAIPANVVKFVVKSLLDQGRVVRGWLGIELQNVDRNLAQALGLPVTSGALVSKVARKGPADQAGLLSGDVVVLFDGHAIHNLQDLRNRVAFTAPGKNVTVKIYRHGKEKTVRAVLGEKKEDTEKPSP